MRIDELALVVIDQAGERGIVGRTRLQKVVYFLCDRLGIDARYAPYYYGPYSEHVARSVDSLIARGLVSEEVKKVRSDGPFEGRRYTYKVTPEGREVVASIETEESGLYEQAVSTRGELLAEGPSTRALAVASKLHVVVERHQRPVHVADLTKRAQSLGWAISKADVSGGVDFLVKQGFVHTIPAS